MSKEWETIPLGDLYEFISGLSKPRSEFGFGHDFLTFKDVLDNYFVPNELSALVNSTTKEQDRCSIKRGDVFLTRTSETQPDLGMSCVALRDYPKATFNGFTKRLRPKIPTAVIPEYAAYFFRSPKFRQTVTSMSLLSTRASLNNEMLSRLFIDLPSITTQKAIGFILKTLDDKIELNRRMNRTLEKMAAAIFKSWFIDFDPVIDKALAAGNPIPDALADRAAGRNPPSATRNPQWETLFPSTFEDSPLGPIPKGWKVRPLTEVIEINPKRTLAKGTLAPFLEMSNMPTKGPSPDTWRLREMTSGMKFINGDTLMARITPCLENGKTAFVDFLNDGKVGWGSTEYIVLRPKGIIPPVFAYLLSRTIDFRTFAIRQMTGSSGRQRVPPKSLNKYQLITPEFDSPLYQAFGEIVQPFFNRIKLAMKQNRRLAGLRDTLLPKLLSGEIELPVMVGD